MTSVTARVRTAAVAAGLVGALALTACSGSDSGSKGSGHDSSPSAGTSASASGGGGSGATATGASGKLQGSWVSTSGGKIVALVITGKEAGLFVTGGTVCSGSAGTESGMQMIHLKCTDGSKDRVTGMVDSVDDNGMKVTWSGKTGEETYTKAEGGKLPSGMPTGLTP
ncbi:hypothetical protein [Streptomyces sp. NPDC047028]|uniref:hypothetical protein n=1 Tax=Streptomyces sp. NPDC047028 TaxID=3155793 RepID=UPI0033C0C8C3